MKTNSLYLCGGTFFVLLLREKRTGKTKKELQNFGSDSLSNTDLMASLIRLFDNTYKKPIGSSLDNRTSLYKKCEISFADCLPFNDDALISAFNMKLTSNYSTLLSEMGELIEHFLTADKESKMQELVFSILTLIKEDSTIKPNDCFYAIKDGSPISKANLLTTESINLPALLLGVWHYILMNRKDNTIGATTIEQWHTTPQEKGDKHTFSSSIGSTYDHNIKISTDYELIIEDTPYIADETDDDIHVEIPKVEIIQEQPTPTITQTIQNQFNFYQTGNGTNIGHAEKVEIRDGKVVNLK